MGLTISHATTMAPCLQLRVQIGTKIKGTLSKRVQALHGLEWCLKTSLVSRVMSDDTAVPPFDWVSHIVRYSPNVVVGDFLCLPHNTHRVCLTARLLLSRSGRRGL